MGEMFRRFRMVREKDVTGYSGTGVVAEGVEFTDGTVVVHWCVPEKACSTVVWHCIEDAVEVHGHGGATVLDWID